MLKIEEIHLDILRCFDRWPPGTWLWASDVACGLRWDCRSMNQRECEHFIKHAIKRRLDRLASNGYLLRRVERCDRGGYQRQWCLGPLSDRLKDESKL